MAFRYGQGGRPKGSKNKRTDLHAICVKHDVNVFEEMLIIAMKTEENKENLKFNRFAKIAEWLYARPKEMEISEDQVRTYLELVANEPKGSTKTS